MRFMRVYLSIIIIIIVYKIDIIANTLSTQYICSLTTLTRNHITKKNPCIYARSLIARLPFKQFNRNAGENQIKLIINRNIFGAIYVLIHVPFALVYSCLKSTKQKTEQHFLDKK